MGIEEIVTVAVLGKYNPYFGVGSYLSLVFSADNQAEDWAALVYRIVQNGNCTYSCHLAVRQDYSLTVPPYCLCSRTVFAPHHVAVRPPTYLRFVVVERLQGTHRPGWQSSKDRAKGQP